MFTFSLKTIETGSATPTGALANWLPEPLTVSNEYGVCEELEPLMMTFVTCDAAGLAGEGRPSPAEVVATAMKRTYHFSMGARSQNFASVRVFHS